MGQSISAVSRSHARLAALTLLLAAALLLDAEPSFADPSAGASIAFYNSGTHGLGINVKNDSTTTGLAAAEFTLPAGTTLTGTPSGGGSCEKVDAKHGRCNYGMAVPPRQQAFILANTEGEEPVSLDVTAHFSDGSAAHLTAAKCPAIGVGPSSLPGGTVGTLYSQQLTGSGGAAPYTFSYEGGLPEGVPLSIDGLLAGTPTKSASLAFSAAASDENGCTGFHPYTLDIEPAATVAVELADVEAVDVAPGVVLEPEEEELELPKGLNFFASEEPERDPEFHEVRSPWFEGDFVQVSVTVRNNGPSTATFAVDAKSSRGQLDYAGFLGPASPPPAPLLGRPAAHPAAAALAPKLTLAAGGEAELIYDLGSQLPAGSVDLEADVVPVSPPDPNPSNNAESDAFRIRPRPIQFRGVAYRGIRSGGEIDGVATPAPAAARPSSTGKGLAKVPPTDFAVLRRAGRRCAWVKASGALQPKPSALLCHRPIFLNAAGARHWSYYFLKAPPSGAYTVFARPRVAPKMTAHQFGPKLHNSFGSRVP